METCEILKGARELLSDPEKWTRGAFARDKVGRSVPIDSPAATSFCLIGAMGRVCGTDSSPAISRSVREIQETLYVEGRRYCGVSTFNDNHIHDQVLEVMDKTIERVCKT